MPELEEFDFTPVGDSACWLNRVCDECGALVEGQPPMKCRRCGAVLAPA